MRGKDWIWFGALHWWQKTLIGVAFGVVLVSLILLPNGLGEYIAIAAIAAVIVASISAIAMARFALDRAWGLVEVRRVGIPALWSAIVIALAIGLIAFVWRSPWVLWLWSVPTSLGWFAWLVFALERSMPRYDRPGL
jgi:hypothetical protein